MTQLILSCNIAGLTHAKPDFTKLLDADRVALIPEPNNQYDSRAVRVEHASGKLGYIPAESTRVYHDAVRNGLKIDAGIYGLDDTGRYPKILLHATVSL